MLCHVQQWNKEKSSIWPLCLTYFNSNDCKVGVTCRKASPSPLPDCWARSSSFLLFSFLLWMLYRQDSKHNSSMKAMRLSRERMATVRGGSLWAEKTRGKTAKTRVGAKNESSITAESLLQTDSAVCQTLTVSCVHKLLECEPLMDVKMLGGVIENSCHCWGLMI